MVSRRLYRRSITSLLLGFLLFGALINLEAWNDRLNTKETFYNEEIKIHKNDYLIWQKINRPLTIENVLQNYRESEKTDLNTESTLKDLGKIIQKAFNMTQNQQQCEKAKKLICDLADVNNGFGSKVHQLVFCHYLAFSLDRILYVRSYYLDRDNLINKFITPLNLDCKDPPKMMETKNMRDDRLYGNNFDNSHQVLYYRHSVQWIRGPVPSSLPGTLPDSMSEFLRKIHPEPTAWMIGQSAEFLVGQLLDNFKNDLNRLRNEYHISLDTIGIHVRHGDKVHRESKYISAEKYVSKVAEYIKAEKSHRIKPISVYIATDDTNVMKELTTVYSNATYRFLNIDEHTNSARMHDHSHYYRVDQLRGLLSDLFLLRECDLVMCTFSSNIGRLLLELRSLNTVQTKTFSMDNDWFYSTTGYEHYVDKVQGFALKETRAKNKDYIAFSRGDWVMLDRNYYNDMKKRRIHLVNATIYQSQGLVDIRNFKIVDDVSIEFDQQFDKLGLLK